MKNAKRARDPQDSDNQQSTNKRPKLSSTTSFFRPSILRKPTNKQTVITNGNLQEIYEAHTRQLEFAVPRHKFVSTEPCVHPAQVNEYCELTTDNVLDILETLYDANNLTPYLRRCPQAKDIISLKIKKMLDLMQQAPNSLEGTEKLDPLKQQATDIGVVRTAYEEIKSCFDGVSNAREILQEQGRLDDKIREVLDFSALEDMVAKLETVLENMPSAMEQTAKLSI
jgi:hypothetical protein